MKPKELNGNPKYIQGAIIFFAAMTILVSCQHSPNLTGKWQETRGRAIFEFQGGHTFNTVDNMGMQVGGKYNLDGQGNIRFEIQHEESEIEFVDARVTVAGDELIFKFGDTGEVERYRRVEP
jgi:hypothetical protein